MKEGKFVVTQHCFARLLTRGITPNDIICCVCNGEIIEEYPNDFPYPSCLVFGYTLDKRIIHVVIGVEEKQLYIITAYFPSGEKFELDFKTRREI